MIHSVGGNFSISDLLQPRAEVKNAEQHGRSSFNTPAQFIKIHLKKLLFLKKLEICQLTVLKR